MANQMQSLKALNLKEKFLNAHVDTNEMANENDKSNKGIDRL
jgi:hypothetical protein